VAIGLDATESSLVRRMLDDGDLPMVQSVLDRGSWARVTSPTAHSSGSVWPNFFTGQRECDHGQYATWNWDSRRMRLAYTDEDRFVPFWKDLVARGTTVGLVDVPFAPFLRLTSGYEVHEWGAHSRIEGRVRVSPPAVSDRVERFATHPFTDDLARPPANPSEVRQFLEDCTAGVRLRGDLAEHLVGEVRTDLSLVVFEEAHHAGHFLWHTVEPTLPMYSDIPAADLPERSLVDLYREMDRQVGRIVEAAGPDATVFVFALHGMEKARGVPWVLEPLLAELGLATVAGDAEGRRSLLSRLKSRVPGPVRDLYRRTVPLSRRSQWGRSGIMPSYDWSTTRAFSLPAEQYGFVRINLAGREAQGIVPADEYDKTCDLVEEAIRALTTVDGRPVALDVVRPPRGAHPDGLPDLVVHWTDAAFEVPALVGGVEVPAIRREQTGQHAWDGFCVAAGPAAPDLSGETIAAEELHHLVLRALDR
jgi:predicted AlkP superfamily phosphohydrolase/phosphomutase